MVKLTNKKFSNKTKKFSHRAKKISHRAKISMKNNKLQMSGGSNNTLTNISYNTQINAITQLTPEQKLNMKINNLIVKLYIKASIIQQNQIKVVKKLLSKNSSNEMLNNIQIILLNYNIALKSSIESLKKLLPDQYKNNKNNKNTLLKPFREKKPLTYEKKSIAYESYKQELYKNKTKVILDMNKFNEKYKSNFDIDKEIKFNTDEQYNTDYKEYIETILQLKRMSAATNKGSRMLTTSNEELRMLTATNKGSRMSKSTNEGSSMSEATNEGSRMSEARMSSKNFFSNAKKSVINRLKSVKSFLKIPCDFTRKDEPLLTEFFLKDIGSRQNKRLFKLFKDEIYYFDVNDKNEPTKCMGKIPLKNIESVSSENNQLIIKTLNEGKTYNLFCIEGENEDSCKSKIKTWIDKINELDNALVQDLLGFKYKQ